MEPDEASMLRRTSGRADHGLTKPDPHRLVPWRIVAVHVGGGCVM